MEPKEIIGHVYWGTFGKNYRVVGIDNGDPRVEEVELRAGQWSSVIATPPRAISIRAIGRTFHHHRDCAECRP